MAIINAIAEYDLETVAYNLPQDYKLLCERYPNWQRTRSLHVLDEQIYRDEKERQEYRIKVYNECLAELAGDETKSAFDDRAGKDQ